MDGNHKGLTRDQRSSLGPESESAGDTWRATFVVDYGRSYSNCVGMKAYPISTRYTAEELKRLDATARQCKMSRAELIHARSLGKIVTTHELADWAEAELATHASRKVRRGTRAA